MMDRLDDEDRRWLQRFGRRQTAAGIRGPFFDAEAVLQVTQAIGMGLVAAT
jgi:hypothetical protein